MTSSQILTVKMIAALLEGIDQDDVKDAELAVKMIRNLLDCPEKKG